MRSAQFWPFFVTQKKVNKCKRSYKERTHVLYMSAFFYHSLIYLFLDEVSPITQKVVSKGNYSVIDSTTKAKTMQLDMLTYLINIWLLK